MHTRRRILVALYGAALFGAACSQGTAKVYRIGWLVGSVPKPANTYGKFVERATQLGYVHGKTLLIDYRSFDTVEEGKALAADLVRLKVDLIVAQAPPALLAARSATQSVPIVTFFVGDPIGMGIVSSLAPGRQRDRLHLGRRRRRSWKVARDHEGALSQRAPIRHAVEPGK
jgi:putative ABC transport system substrate-binding protein